MKDFIQKNCGTYVCGKNNFEHLVFHLEGILSSDSESRKNKKFHSIFINPYTT